MVVLAQVSEGDTGETHKAMRRNVILWFPPFSKGHAMKDPGQIAEHLADRGYNVKIVCYGGNADSGIATRNEQSNICRRLIGVRWTDNIAVVHSGSTNRTQSA